MLFSLVKVRRPLYRVQCPWVYPYPRLSETVGRNSDHGPSKTQTKTQTTPDSVFTRLSFWKGETQTMIKISVSQGVRVDPVLMKGAREGGRRLRKDVFLPSKNLSTFFYEMFPFKNPYKNPVFTENPLQAPSKNSAKKQLRYL